MASQATENPFQNFTDLKGQPLSNGYVFIGEPDKAPQEYPIPIYWDAAMTIPAMQPLRTMYGYIWRNGGPANVWVNGNYSMQALEVGAEVNQPGPQVFYSPSWTAASSDNISFIGVGTGAITRSVQDRERDSIHVTDYLGVDSTGATDSTAGFALATTAAYSAGKSLIVPAGTYLLSEWVFSGKELMSVVMEGCTLKVFNPLSSSEGLIRISTSPGLSIQGTFYVDMQYSMTYKTAILCDSGYVHLWDPRIYRANLCYIFGDETAGHTPEYGVSEIFVHGGYTWACNRLVEAWGANTVVTFNGSGLLTGSLADQQGMSPPAFQNADTTTATLIGAAMYVVGGYLVNVRNDYPTVNLQPIDTTDVTYGKPYGTLICSGSAIESNWFLETTNPDALVSTNVNIGVSLTACKGYWGVNRSYIDLDANFKQSIKIDGTCSFYTQSTHTAKLVDSASASANIYIDQAAFKQYWMQGLLNIDGGIPHFTQKNILSRNTSTTLVDDSSTTVDFTANGPGNSSLYGSAYYAAGVFTVPPGGLEDIQIHAQIFFGAPITDVADLSILIDGGTAIAFGWMKSAQIMAVDAIIPTLNAGQTIQIKAATNSVPQALGGGQLNQFSIIASRP